MLETAGLSTKFLKKESYSGSYNGMRYTIKKGDENLIVYAYTEPWSLENTPEENLLTKDFSFSEAGVQEAVDWLSSLYSTNRKFFDTASKNKMANMLTGTYLSIPRT